MTDVGDGAAGGGAGSAIDRGNLRFGLQQFSLHCVRPPRLSSVECLPQNFFLPSETSNEHRLVGSHCSIAWHRGMTRAEAVGGETTIETLADCSRRRGRTQARTRDAPK